MANAAFCTWWVDIFAGMLREASDVCLVYRNSLAAVDEASALATEAMVEGLRTIPQPELPMLPAPFTPQYPPVDDPADAN